LDRVADRPLCRHYESETIHAVSWFDDAD